jgi:photosystem II stability/assembly factor-like uncharacterized protein
LYAAVIVSCSSKESAPLTEARPHNEPPGTLVGNETCATPPNSWIQRNALAGLIIHDGVVLDRRDGECLILLGGEETKPRRPVTLLSDDGGLTFKVSAAFPNSLYVRALASNHNQAVAIVESADGFSVLSSNNAGLDWTQLEPTFPSESFRIRDAAVDTNQVLVVGSNDCVGVLLASQDGGTNWDPQLTLKSETGCAILTRVVALEDRVLATGETGDGPQLFYKSNNAKEFESVALPAGLSGITAVAYVGNDALLVCGFVQLNAAIPESRVARVYLGPLDGSAWQGASLPGEIGPASDVLFTDSSVGYMVTGRRVYQTTDGGESWTEDYRSSSPVGTYERIFRLDDAIFAVGEAGLIVRSPP